MKSKRVEVFVCELPYAEPKQLIDTWGEKEVFIGLGSYSSRFFILPILFTEISFDDLLLATMDLPWQTAIKSESEKTTSQLPFLCGYMGCIPYEQFTDFVTTAKTTAKLFWIQDCLIFDLKEQSLFHCQTNFLPNQGTQQYDFRVLFDQLNSQQLIKNANVPSDFKSIHLELIEHTEPEKYLEQCQQSIDFIREGRFYQINLLRYFSVRGISDWKQLAYRVLLRGGAFSCIFRFPGFKVFSFTPERFVAFNEENEIKTWPIKGTAQRVCDDYILDQEMKEQLSRSPKDRAELNMIVDLMRNDLNRVCERGSVIVEDPGSVYSFPNVHHLIACVKGRLQKKLSAKDFFAALFPAGSITGAPKIEVMKAIREFEQRERDFFMGNVFLWDIRGRFDSSVLIRTIEDLSEGLSIADMEFAAGSGIVLPSDPVMELEEIAHKAKIINFLAADPRARS